MIILSKITSSKISDLIWAMSTYLYWLECVCEVLWPQTHFLPPVRAIFDSAFWHWTITLKGGCPSCVTLDLQAVLCELEIWLHAVLYGLLCTHLTTVFLSSLSPWGSWYSKSRQIFVSKLSYYFCLAPRRFVFEKLQAVMQCLSTIATGKKLGCCPHTEVANCKSASLYYESERELGACFLSHAWRRQSAS